MTNLTNQFGTLFHPQKAFVVYEQQNTAKHIYVESYDFDCEGRPFNAHPLSLSEAGKLSKALLTSERKHSSFLSLKGLMPKNLLFLRTQKNPCAIWHTQPARVRLYFKEDLGIKSGWANVPSLIWRATKTSLWLYAVRDAEVNEGTPLFNAPFFNIYDDGKVCMGNVSIEVRNDCPLEDFMLQWQDSFFNSYFSHLLQGFNPIKGNIVQLWKKLVNENIPFPADKLIPNQLAIKNLIQ